MATGYLAIIVMVKAILTTREAYKAQLRRRASVVPNLIAIRFDCSTAEVRLCGFRRRARVVPNILFALRGHVTLFPCR